mmetsp:Transcript_2575/g.8514  ORF Transcript_2575/g.8514 Transcript_2575/m.8514 type:complete len:89 (-) Transcript_2575:3660-3926(-)
MNLSGTSIKFQLFHESKSLEEKLVGEAILQENVLDRIMHRGVHTMEEHSLNFKDLSGTILTGKGGLESILYCQLYVTDQGSMTAALGR